LGVDRWLGNKHPRGESGILKEVSLTKIKPANLCYLYIDHEGSSYIGCLLFDDETFCRQMINVFQAHYNHPIIEIGSLDLSYLL
jgi:hypothetical protein